MDWCKELWRWVGTKTNTEILQGENGIWVGVKCLLRLYKSNNLHVNELQPRLWIRRFISTWKSKTGIILWKADAMQWDINFKTVLGLFGICSQASFNAWKMLSSTEEPLKTHAVSCHGRVITVCFAWRPSGASRAINAAERLCLLCTAGEALGRTH